MRPLDPPDLNEWTHQSPRQDHAIDFQSGGVLTLGVEVELQVIDRTSLNVSPQAPRLLEEAGPTPALKPEFYLNSAEINSGKCQNLHEIARDLGQGLDLALGAADRLGLAIATTGCHPFSRYSDCIITPTPRYEELIDRNQWLTRRMTVYGLHVHIGMRSGDDCIRFNNFFLHVLPHLLALSASSPDWQGEDTGLASCRPTTYEALPTAGLPYQVANWRQFEALCETLRRCDSIRSLKDLWWDMRPSPGFGTLEIRVCDGPASLAEALAITAFVHLLAHWFDDHGGWIEQVPPPPRWLGRENKWRVMRYGLDAQLVANTEGETRPVRQGIADWLDKLAPYCDRLGYGDQVALLRQICDRGNSAQRQRAVFQRSQSLAAVVAHNIDECRSRRPIWPA